MSTRSQIGFYDEDELDLSKPTALLYRHCDGYPDTKHGVLETMKPVLIEAQEECILHSDEKLASFVVVEWAKKGINTCICNHLHGDIEYYYAVYPTHIDVFSACWGQEFENLKDPERYDFRKEGIVK